MFPSSGNMLSSVLYTYFEADGSSCVKMDVTFPFSFFKTVYECPLLCLLRCVLSKLILRLQFLRFA
jgi:hypothetical protein